MAEKKMTAAAPEAPETTQDPWERIPFYIERTDANQEAQEYIAVNGRNFVIPKGVRVMIPRCVVDEYNRSKKMKQKQFARKDRMIQESLASAIAAGIIK